MVHPASANGVGRAAFEGMPPDKAPPVIETKDDWGTLITCGRCVENKI
jgi:hypothetical protein